MNTVTAEERNAVKTLRSDFSSLPQRQLARRIKGVDFASAQNRENARVLSNRTEASIYGLIRRIDNTELNTQTSQSSSSGVC